MNNQTGSSGYCANPTYSHYGDMSTVGRIEKKSQQRVVALFRDTLGYACFGDWIDREDNRDIEPDR